MAGRAVGAEGGVSLETQILQANPILEYFGTPKPKGITTHPVLYVLCLFGIRLAFVWHSFAIGLLFACYSF